MIKNLLRWLAFRWLHRGETKLWDDVWRRPDGSCVNDAGKVLGKHWEDL